MSAVLLSCRPPCHLPNSPSDDSRVFAEISHAAACPRATEEDSVTGIVMEHQQDTAHHSVRLKRVGGAGSGGSGGATPAGLSPGAVSAVGAVAGVAPSSANAVRSTSSSGGATKLRQTPPRHFTFDFREPDLMEDFRAQRLQRKFREKLGAKSAKYELVAGFHLDDGIVLSYHPFRTRIHFELTERRRKILGRYYRNGQQEVLLYVDRSEFEYYTPVCCYQPPASSAQAKDGSGKRNGKGLAASCFAISGCVS